MPTATTEDRRQPGQGAHAFLSDPLNLRSPHDGWLETVGDRERDLGIVQKEADTVVMSICIQGMERENRRTEPMTKIFKDFLSPQRTLSCGQEEAHSGKDTQKRSFRGSRTGEGRPDPSGVTHSPGGKRVARVKVRTLPSGKALWAHAGLLTASVSLQPCPISSASLFLCFVPSRVRGCPSR